jgi:HD-GYP domain-containing protein (c-di-GMP phosphodiesterase class II)
MTSATTIPSSVHLGRRPYVAIDLASLRADRPLSFDLFVHVEGKMILYREKSLPFSEDVRKRLMENRVKQLYIHEAQRQTYLGYIESAMPGLLADLAMTPAAKADLVYSTSKAIAENIFTNPTFGNNIERINKLVEQTVEFLSHGPEAFRHLVKTSDTHYKLHSHSVNVCIFALGIAQQYGLDDPDELSALGIGAMLHDVGKTRIDIRIMKKRSPLSHAEYELMKKHVEFGYDVLAHMDGIPKSALIPVLQHNEREDGSGYPSGLHSNQIHLFGKITAIADIFDAMTTDRVFRKASSAYEAFKEMLAMPLDQELLKNFIALLGPDPKY